jgi:Tol biopolymer transport system component
MTLRAFALAAALAPLALACAGPGMIDLKRLPPSPLAVIYRDERLSLDRIDALRDAEKFRTPSTAEGVIRVETLDAMLGGAPDVQRRLRHVQGRLSLVDPLTGEAEQLTDVPMGAAPLSWSRDRSKLLLTAYWREIPQLFLWDRATGASEIQTSGPGEHPLGCLGADGRLVAVEATRSEGRVRARLVASPPGGGGLRPLTDGIFDISPTCSPTAPLVAFVTADDTGVQWIAVLALDQEGARPRRFGRGTQPVFTPDGAWIVYSAKTTQGQRLVRMRPDGSGRTPVGAGPDDEGQPAVSPDGAYVAYVVTDLTKRERLRVRRFPDGSGDRPLVTTGDASTPVW